MEVNGLPLHPLVLHATVVLVPLAALTAALFALLPGWRWLLRTPTLLLAVGGAALTWFTALTGEDLQDARGIQGSQIEKHAMWAGRLELSMWVLAAVVVVAWWVLPSVSRLVGGRDHAARVGALVLPTTIVLPIVAAVVLVLTYLTGDAGARAVWG